MTFTVSKKSVKSRRHHRPFDICYSNRGLQERKQQVVTIIAMSGAVCLNDAKYDDEKLCGAGYMQHYTMTYVHISWKKTASICEKWQNTGGYYRLLRPGVTS